MNNAPFQQLMRNIFISISLNEILKERLINLDEFRFDFCWILFSILSNTDVLFAMQIVSMPNIKVIEHFHKSGQFIQFVYCSNAENAHFLYEFNHTCGYNSLECFLIYEEHGMEPLSHEPFCSWSSFGFIRTFQRINNVHVQNEHFIRLESVIVKKKLHGKRNVHAVTRIRWKRAR